MSFNYRKSVAAIGAVLALGGIGTGLALASSPGQSAQPPVVSAPAQAGVTALDTIEANVPDAAEVAGSESATEPANERGLEPANGHEDAPGQNIDHQFEGVE